MEIWKKMWVGVFFWTQCRSCSTPFNKTRKPSFRWQTRATRKYAKTAPIRRENKPSGGKPSNVNEIYTSMKSTFRVLQFCRWQYESISIRFTVVASQICEILRKFKLIAVQGHPRSLILVSIESAYATSYYWWTYLLPLSRYWCI